jgi:hypothetical protein
MAQTPYTTKLLQASSNVQTLNETLRSIKDHKSTEYSQILAALVDANKEYAALQQQEKDFLKAGDKQKKTEDATTLQTELNIASAGNDAAKVKDLAGKIAALGGTPYDASGNALDPKTGLIASAKQPVTGTKDVTTPGSKIKTGTDGKPVVDGSKPNVPVKKDTTASTSTGGGYTATTGTLYLADPKSTFRNYLTQAFSTVDDPKSKVMIDTLFKDAVTFKYSDAEFLKKLNDIPWWQNQSPSIQDFVLKSNDPRYKGTLEAQIGNKADAVASLMGSLGLNIMDIDPVTGQKVDRTGIIHGLAVQAVQNNWSASQLQEHIASNNATIFTRGGTIGSQLDSVKHQALLYGVNVDSGYEKIIANDLMDPKSGRDAAYYKYQFQQQAMNGAWKPFAQAIKDGQDLYSITNTYRDSMSKLLEVDPSQISWSDLQKGIIDENGNARTTADFTKQVKNNPLWQYTQNAKDTYTSLGENLMKQFGFVG